MTANLMEMSSLNPLSYVPSLSGVAEVLNKDNGDKLVEMISQISSDLVNMNTASAAFFKELIRALKTEGTRIFLVKKTSTKFFVEVKNNKFVLSGTSN